MTALKILGVLLLVFLLLGFLRVGALVSFGDELRVRLRAGPFRLTILPKKEKKGRKKPEKQPKEAHPDAEKRKKQHKLPKPTLPELFDLIETALSALGATARRACLRLCVDPLEATVVFGGNDPAQVAMAYGAASSALFTLMPKAEECFHIPDPSLHLRMDYGAERTTAQGKAGFSLRVCDLFAIAFTLLPPLVKWFLRFKKAHRKDAAERKAPAPEAEEPREKNEQIA